MRLLIVEDEQALAAGLKFNFEQEGYDVVLAGDGPTAINAFQSAQPPIDLIVMDLMLPGMSGYEVCSAIRELDRLVPILVLSARTLSEDKMHAFDCGTDQYMTKPFALPELINRIHHLLERNRVIKDSAKPAEESAPSQILEFGNVRVDTMKFEVQVGDRKHRLTMLEMDLLKYFVEHEGTVLSRFDILEKVWDPDADVTTRTIDNFVMRLRKIVEPDPSRPVHICSVRGIGYRFLRTPET